MKKILFIFALLFIAFSFSGCYTTGYLEARGASKYRGQGYKQPYRNYSPNPHYRSQAPFGHGGAHHGMSAYHH